MTARARATLSLLLLGAALPALGQPTVGLIRNDDPTPGFTLFSPSSTFNTHLINNDGLLVRSWAGSAWPGMMAYLTPWGTMIRSERVSSFMIFPGSAGQGGRFEEYDFAGNLIWELEYGNSDTFAHHDFEIMPDGNLLLIAWDHVPAAEAIAAGNDPGVVVDHILLESIVEIEPTRPLGGNVVWEWHARDHLIQDLDPTKANFGVVADHPGRIDVNHSAARDLIHFNSVDYNPELDQIILSAWEYNEIWIIDHSTTTAEAAGHTGGNGGKGGDLLYRWGNPRAYGRGDVTDQLLFRQHDAQWIESGLPGAGNILLFNNRVPGPSGEYSTVNELVPPVDGNGDYPLAAGEAHGPAGFVWSYQGTPPESFHASNTSGASRLPNGNTLTNTGQQGRIFEIRPDGTITWEYQNPDTGAGLLSQGTLPTVGGMFKARRYLPDYPGFAGVDLTPGDPLEQFMRPAPAEGGSLEVTRLDAPGTELELRWLDDGCPSFDYNVLFGDLANVATTSIGGAVCSVGTSNVAIWSGVPASDQFFFVVGTDDTNVYESSWGNGSDGTLRGATKASFRCGTTTKVIDAQCP